jgi:hypothetical protein
MKLRWKKVLPLTLATLCIAYTALLLRTKYLSCPHYGRRLAQKILLRKDAADANTEFRLHMSLTEKGPKGFLVDGYVYQTTDCVAVFSGFYELASPSEAQENIQERVRTSHRVYEHTAQTDAVGNVVLERAVTKVALTGDYFVLRRQGNRIHEISSESLPHALEFEKRLSANSQAPRPPN